MLICVNVKAFFADPHNIRNSDILLQSKWNGNHLFPRAFRLHFITRVLALRLQVIGVVFFIFYLFLSNQIRSVSMCCHAPRLLCNVHTDSIDIPDSSFSQSDFPSHHLLSEVVTSKFLHPLIGSATFHFRLVEFHVINARFTVEDNFRPQLKKCTFRVHF